MEINNELRRARMKLYLLENMEAINWLLTDMIHLTEEIEDVRIESSQDEITGRIKILTRRYKQEIASYSPKDKTQQKLFND